MTANYSIDSVSVLRNLGSGAFAAPVSYGVADGPLRLTAADLNGDGKLDLVTVNLLSSNVSVLRNLGNGTFATKVDYAVKSLGMSVTAADIDGDHDLDLLVGNRIMSGTLGTVSVLRNQGNGTFGQRVDYNMGTHPYSVQAVDLDGDGDLDLLSGAGIVYLRLNLGNGTFGPVIRYSMGAGEAFAADFGGDGLLDLMSANTGRNVAILPHTWPGDLDGDRDVDGADFVAWQTNFPKTSGAALWQGDADVDGDVDGADFVIWQNNFPHTPSPGFAASAGSANSGPSEPEAGTANNSSVPESAPPQVAATKSASALSANGAKNPNGVGVIKQAIANPPKRTSPIAPQSTFVMPISIDDARTGRLQRTQSRSGDSQLISSLPRKALLPVAVDRWLEQLPIVRSRSVDSVKASTSIEDGISLKYVIG